MSTKKPSIERSLKALDKAEPEIAAIAARVRNEVGPGPRSALELAVLRGLRLALRGDDHSVRLEGSTLVFGSKGGLWDAAIFLQIARWELREVTHDESRILMLRDMLQDLFSARSQADRRRDARIMLAGVHAALNAVERSVAHDVEHVRRLAKIAQVWADGGPVPSEASRYEKLANATHEQLCSCDNSDRCQQCLANDAIGREFYSSYDAEEAVVRLFDWAVGRELSVDLDKAIDSLMSCSSLRRVEENLREGILTAIDAAEASERAATAA